MSLLLQRRRCGFNPWVGKIPWSKKSPLQYFLLGNLMDRGYWWATVHGSQKWKWKSLSRVQHFGDPVDYTIHGILQARTLEWVAFPFSRGSSQTQGSNPGLSSWTSKEASQTWFSATCMHTHTHTHTHTHEFARIPITKYYILCDLNKRNLFSHWSGGWQSKSKMSKIWFHLRPLFETPCLGFTVLHLLLEFAQTHIHGGSDVIQPSRSLLSPSPAFSLSQH